MPTIPTPLTRSPLDSLACVNVRCELYGQAGQGNLTVRKIYGADRIRYLRCRACRSEFSVRKQTALWHIWDMGFSLSPWKDELVAWVFDGDAGNWRTNTSLPSGYQEFCLAHRLWMAMPATFGIPLRCNELDRVTLLSLTLHNGAGQYTLAKPRMVQDEFSSLSDYDYHSGLVQRGSIVSLATVVDYIVATYGRDRLASLIVVSGRYDSWDTLVPEVFGVSMAGFEQGWRDHVDKLVRCAGEPACP